MRERVSCYHNSLQKIPSNSTGKTLKRKQTKPWGDLWHYFLHYLSLSSNKISSWLFCNSVILKMNLFSIFAGEGCSSLQFIITVIIRPTLLWSPSKNRKLIWSDLLKTIIFAGKFRREFARAFQCMCKNSFTPATSRVSYYSNHHRQVHRV